MAVLAAARGAAAAAARTAGVDGTANAEAAIATVTANAAAGLVTQPAGSATATGTAYTTQNHATLSGSSGSYISMADAAALDIVGDIEMWALVALDDWTPAGSSANLIAKYTTTGNQRSYRMTVSTTGRLAATWTTDGTSGTLASLTSSVAPTVTDGDFLWVGVTLDVDNGASGRTARMYTHVGGRETDPTVGTATQLGTDQTAAGVTSIHAGTAVLELGSINAGTGELHGMRIRRAFIRSGIGGTVVASYDANLAYAAGGDYVDAVGSAGGTWVHNNAPVT